MAWLVLKHATTDLLVVIISKATKYTFWCVIPTLPMFLAFPGLHGKPGFWGAIAASVILTVACFFVVALIARVWNTDLML